MATTKKSEATDSNADVLEAILIKLGAMEDRISDMETKSSEPPKLFPNIEAPMEHDRIPEGTAVRLRESSERHTAILSKLDTLPQNVRDDIENNGVLGYITDRFYENKITGDHKYKVNFAGVGSVGIKLSDLEFVN